MNIKFPKNNLDKLKRNYSLYEDMTNFHLRGHTHLKGKKRGKFNNCF